jgi:hypothetical protein
MDRERWEALVRRLVLALLIPRIRTAAADADAPRASWIRTSALAACPGVPPLLVAGLRVKRPLLKPVSADADRRLAARVADALDLGAPFYVIPPNRKTRRLRKRLRRTVAPAYARATA